MSSWIEFPRRPWMVCLAPVPSSLKRGKSRICAYRWHKFWLRFGFMLSFCPLVKWLSPNYISFTKISLVPKAPWRPEKGLKLSLRKIWFYLRCGPCNSPGGHCPQVGWLLWKVPYWTAVIAPVNPSHIRSTIFQRNLRLACKLGSLGLG